MPWAGNDESARCRGRRAHRLPERSTENATETAPSDLDGLDYALSVTEDKALNAMIATDFSEYFGRAHVLQLPVTDGPGRAARARVPVLFGNSATRRRDRIRRGAGWLRKRFRATWPLTPGMQLRRGVGAVKAPMI